MTNKGISVISNDANSNWEESNDSKFDLIDPIHEVMVMEEMPVARTPYLYNRGDYEQAMHPVETNTPEALPPFPEDYPKNRRALIPGVL